VKPSVLFTSAARCREVAAVFKKGVEDWKYGLREGRIQDSIICRTLQTSGS